MYKMQKILLTHTAKSNITFPKKSQTENDFKPAFPPFIPMSGIAFKKENVYFIVRLHVSKGLILKVHYSSPR